MERLLGRESVEEALAGGPLRLEFPLQIGGILVSGPAPEVSDWMARRDAVERKRHLQPALRFVPVLDRIQNVPTGPIQRSIVSSRKPLRGRSSDRPPDIRSYPLGGPR